MEIGIIILYVMLSLVIGAGFGFLIGKKIATKTIEEVATLKAQKKATESNLTSQKSQYQALKQAHDLLSQKSTTQETDLALKEAALKNSQENLKAQQTALKDMKAQMTAQFKQLAHDVFKQKGDEFKAQNNEQLDAILKPLKENIGKFEKTIKDNYDTENKERASLKTEVASLLELNKQLSEGASNLTKALKGSSQTQGSWGEMQLEGILTNSGLKKGIHFRAQYSETGAEGGAKRPDFIIDLPDGKNLIIDAKVSLTAYERYCNTERKDEQKKALREHVTSLHNHINGLSAKHYQDLDGINTPDYVLMFVAVEPGLYLALQDDNTLFEKALQKNIVLVSGSTLVATMRTISYIWKQDSQEKHVAEMAALCGALYDKFVAFTNHLQEVGKKIDAAKNTIALAEDSHNKAIGSLTEGRGNLVKRVEEIKDKGAETSRSIDKLLLQKVDTDT